MKLTDSRPGAYLVGDALNLLHDLPEKSVWCAVTSPPYWDLRSYLGDDHPSKVLELGSEVLVEEYIEKLVRYLMAVHRVLRDDGTLWLNLGDTYVNDHGGGEDPKHPAARAKTHKRARATRRRDRANVTLPSHRAALDLPEKSLVGVPWRVIFRLQEEGWIHRGEIVWEKPAPMPEGVADRPTRSHEYLFQLVKSGRYHYDQEAGKEPVSGTAHARSGFGSKNAGIHPKGEGATRNVRQNARFSSHLRGLVEQRNRRSVWRVLSERYSGAHFAHFPRKLVLPCIMTSCPPGQVVLDPFMGTGTTAIAAEEAGRSWLGIDLNPTYADMAAERLREARAARARREAKLAALARAWAQGGLALGGAPLAGFSTIVVDPPWPYDDPGSRGGTAKHYAPMTLEAICALRIAAVAARNSHLYLWVTNHFVEEGHRVLRAWGFRYVTMLTWVKDKIGPGRYFRNTTEHVLFAVRGNAPILRRDLPTHFEAPRGAHSAKPPLFRAIVEEASPDGRLEVFARGPSAPGWMAWGDQATGLVLPPAALLGQ